MAHTKKPHVALIFKPPTAPHSSQSINLLQPRIRKETSKGKSWEVVSMTSTLTPRTASPTPSNASSFVDDASTRAIFDGTPGQKPRIEFVETLNSGLQPDFAEQLTSDTSSTRAIFHGSRPGIYPTSSSASSNPSSPLPRLAALRGMSYRDQRLELGGVNTHQQPPDIQDWQNATEDGESATSEDVWMAKEDQTSVTDSTVAEEMEEQKVEGGVGDEDRRRRLALEKGKDVSG